MPRWALPFLPAAGCSGPGLKLNTLVPLSLLTDLPRPLRPRNARFPVSPREKGLEAPGFLLRLVQTDLAAVQRESGTWAWPVYALTLLPKNLEYIPFLQSALIYLEFTNSHSARAWTLCKRKQITKSNWFVCTFVYVCARACVCFVIILFFFWWGQF